MLPSIQSCIDVQMSMHRMGVANNLPPEVVNIMKDFLFDNVRMMYIQEYTQMNKLQLHLDLENIDLARTLDDMEWSVCIHYQPNGKDILYGSFKTIQGINCGYCGNYVGSVTDLTTPIARNIWCECTDHGDFTIVHNPNGSIRMWPDDLFEDEEEYDF